MHQTGTCIYFCSVSRDGNLPDISSAGSIYHFLMDLHKQFGPIASFWWGKTYTVSIASPELFEEQLDLTERPRKYSLTFRLL